MITTRAQRSLASHLIIDENPWRRHKYFFPLKQDLILSFNVSFEVANRRNIVISTTVRSHSLSAHPYKTHDASALLPNRAVFRCRLNGLSAGRDLHADPHSRLLRRRTVWRRK